MPVDDEPDLIDQEYADDTLLFLYYSPDVLDTMRYALEVFCVASGARISWDKTYGILAGSYDIPTWGSGEFRWIRPGETWYLGFQAIWENIGMRLQFSSSFHPQTDGQSEIANSLVLDLLKSYISDQKTQWKRCLPLVEFAYNNTIHSSTGKAPFEIVEGVRKVPPFLSTKDKILEANEYTRDLDTDFAKVRETLQKSEERQKKAADRHRRDSKLKENDWVLLRFDKARLR
ncbi:hypothetical protein L7F22_055768 [Adiantum nelumboides]|nr:hypothetical protein [Adiantum nelumboides]